jgi:D-3-phosphoglycerate dehydrogenase / 2-oxoglutarate reductase
LKKFKVIVTDYLFKDFSPFIKTIGKIDADVNYYQCYDENELMSIVADADAVYVHFAPLTRKVIEAMKRCKVISRSSAGYENIDVQAATDCNINVAYVPDYGVDDVSDHAIMLIMACVKKLWKLALSVRRREWNYDIARPIHRLKGSTLGLVGYGRIAQLAGKKAQALGMRVIAADPFIPAEFASKMNVELVEIDALLKESDVVSVHAPLGEKTKHLINSRSFDLMKSSAYIVNTARGAVICEADLIDALRKGKIAGAALDVLENESVNAKAPLAEGNPLLEMENVLITPHSAFYSEEAIEALLSSAADEIVRCYNGEPPRFLVNKR